MADEDLWRYSRISELDLGRYVPGASAGPPAVMELGTWPEASALLDHVGERSGLAVVVDGVPVSFELSPTAGAAGAVLGSLLDDPRGVDVLDQVSKLNSATGKEEHLPDVFDHLGDAFLSDAVLLSVPARVRVDHPIVIVHVLAPRADAEVAQAVSDRTVIDLGEAAEATVIELFVSDDGALLVVPIVDISVGDAATLSYNSIQQLGAGAWQFAHQRVRGSGRDGPHVHGVPRGRVRVFSHRVRSGRPGWPCRASRRLSRRRDPGA